MVEKLDMEILPASGGWIFIENGNKGTMPYATREAAFEAVVGSVSNAPKEGMEVSIRIVAVPGRTLE